MYRVKKWKKLDNPNSTLNSGTGKKCKQGMEFPSKFKQNEKYKIRV